MRIALELAKQSFYQGEVPIGAILVDAKGKVIAKGRNQVETTKDPTQHAELQCIQAATRVCGNWRLLNTTLYSTLEPCAMCLSALQLARVSFIVYGAKDFRLGAIESWYPLVQVKHPYHRITHMGGILEEECAEWIQKFFSNIRTNKRFENEYGKSFENQHFI
ncbi:tRNA-specific adenosine deaminase [Galdieria sulphuraria]|nr:tRNA-specific adenosine deaminase [Galdieria sulphuraria]